MITSLELEWFNCSCHCVYETSRTKIRIYKSTRRVIYEEFDGTERVLLKQEGRFDKVRGNRFFHILNEINDLITRQADYSIDVCDGFCWKIKFRHSNNKIQSLNGTIEYPPHGKRIERELLLLCEEANISNPTLFGCEASWHLIKEFTDKWLSIFKAPPPEANWLFEEFMGNDCWAVGFEMDCGRSFIDAYSTDEALNTSEALSKIINKIDDVELLGSAIFSKWRSITHWSYESGFTDENKAWFITALERLDKLI